jgi:hypothetical protein
MASSGEPPGTSAGKQATAALERRIAQLTFLACSLAADGRPERARRTRELIILLQDDLDHLRAAR